MTASELEVRQQFEQAIEKDQTDLASRLIFADWLDEHDMCELARWHRSWTPEREEARKYLVELAEDAWFYWSEEELGASKFNHLLRIVRQAIADGELTLDSDHAMDVLNEAKRAGKLISAWEAWTGEEADEDAWDVRFYCSC